MSTGTPSESFSRLLESWWPGYRALMRSVFAVKHEGEYKILRGVVAPQRSLPSIDTTFKIETTHLFAAREWISLDKDFCSSLINALRHRPLEVEISGKVLSLPAGKISNANFHLSPITSPRFPGPLRLPSLLITPLDVNWPSVPHEDTLDLELLSHDALPFRRTPDLLNSLGFPIDLVRARHAPSMEWFLVPPTVIKQSDISSKADTYIEIEDIGGLDAQSFRIGLNIFRRDRPVERHVLSASEIQWAQGPSGLIGKAAVDLRDATAASAFLVYENEFLGETFLRNPERSLNLKFDIFRVFDKKNFVQEKSISDQDSTRFEDSVALLCSLIGLDVFKGGAIRELSEGPDILALSKANHLYVIECSIGRPDHKGKLLKLFNRAKEIRDVTQTQGWGLADIRPVLVTALSREQTLESYKECADYRISLICREDIASLANRLETPPSATELYSDALRAIPQPNAQPGLFPGGVGEDSNRR